MINKSDQREETLSQRARQTGGLSRLALLTAPIDPVNEIRRSKRNRTLAACAVPAATPRPFKVLPFTLQHLY